VFTDLDTKELFVIKNFIAAISYNIKRKQKREKGT
jgi:hypothetical protein